MNGITMILMIFKQVSWFHTGGSMHCITDYQPHI